MRFVSKFHETEIFPHLRHGDVVGVLEVLAEPVDDGEAGLLAVPVEAEQVDGHALGSLGVVLSRNESYE